MSKMSRERSRRHKKGRAKKRNPYWPQIVGRGKRYSNADLLMQNSLYGKFASESNHD